MRFLECTSFQRKYWPLQKSSNYYEITSYSNPYWWIMIFKVLISSLIVYLLEVLTIHQMVWKKNELEKSSSKCDVTFIYLISNKQKFCLTELFVITNYIKYWIPDKIENNCQLCFTVLKTKVLICFQTESQLKWLLISIISFCKILWFSTKFNLRLFC